MFSCNLVFTIKGERYIKKVKNNKIDSVTSKKPKVTQQCTLANFVFQALDIER